MKKKKTCSTTTLSQKVYEGDFYSHVFANPVSCMYIYNIKSHDRTAVLLWLLIIYIVIKAKNASEVLNYNSIILFIAPEKLTILESCSNQFRMYIMFHKITEIVRVI